MSDEFENVDERDFAVCMMVDRAPTLGKAELIYNGRRIEIKAEFGMPARIARWYFGNRNTQHRVVAEDGSYQPRLAIKDGPEDLLTLLGPEAFDTSPITPAKNMAEGWDTSTVSRATPMRALTVQVPAGQLTERAGRETRVGAWGGA